MHAITWLIFGLKDGQNFDLCVRLYSSKKNKVKFIVKHMKNLQYFINMT